MNEFIEQALVEDNPHWSGASLYQAHNEQAINPGIISNYKQLLHHHYYNDQI